MFIAANNILYGGSPGIMTTHIWDQNVVKLWNNYGNISSGA